MANLQMPPKTLHESFEMIADGYMQEAMHTAHIAADSFESIKIISLLNGWKDLDNSQYLR